MTRDPVFLSDTDHDGPGWHAMLDLYVDGVLSAEDASAFEARLRVDPALAHELEVQCAIGSALRRRFSPPSDIRLPDAPAAGPVSPAHAPSILARIGWFRVAAIIAIAVLAGIVFGMRYWARTAYPVESPIEAYRSLVQAGFQPYEVCTDEAEFAHYTKRHFDKALVVKAFQGLALIGWDNRHSVMSIETDALLATVDGTQVVVFMDRAEHARALPKQGEGLNVFRRRVGGVELVEVSPLPEAKLLPGFVVAE
jgi:hypothetical protein